MDSTKVSHFCCQTTHVVLKKHHKTPLVLVFCGTTVLPPSTRRLWQIWKMDVKVVLCAYRTTLGHCGGKHCFMSYILLIRFAPVSCCRTSASSCLTSASSASSSLSASLMKPPSGRSSFYRSSSCVLSHLTSQSTKMCSQWHVDLS